MRIFRRKGSPYWWVTFNDQNGTRYRRSSGTTDKRLAETLAANWIKEAFMEQHFGKLPEVPFSDALLAYAKMQKRDHPKHFRDKTRYRLNSLMKQFGSVNIFDITIGRIQEFMDERLVDVSRGTVQKDVSTLRAILNKAYREGFLATPPRVPQFRKPTPRKRWITPEEEAQLVTHAADHLVPLIRFAVDTGGRRAELLELDWRQVDLVHKRVTFLNTKNGEDRTIRLCDRACAVLGGLGPKENGSVFTYKGKAIKSVRTSFIAARRAAGLDDVRFHDLRHTFASRLAQAGVPLYEIQLLMGHKSLEMVQRYAHLAPDYQERAISVLNKLGHKTGTAPNRLMA